MAKITKFEEIRAWKMSKEIANSVYRLSNETELSKDFGLKDQMRRAAGSMMHNIAEGFDAGSDPEFIRFLRYSLRSATELQSQMYLALDLGYVEKSEFEALYSEVNIAKNHLHGFIAYLVKSKTKQSLSEPSSNYYVEVANDDFWTT